MSSAQYRPSLGSKIVRAPGSQWSETEFPKDEAYGPKVEESALPKIANASLAAGRVDIAVLIERDVV